MEEYPNEVEPFCDCLTYYLMAAKDQVISDGGPPSGYLFPCSPEINWLVSLFAKNRKILLFFPVPSNEYNILLRTVPNIVLVTQFPLNLAFVPKK